MSYYIANKCKTQNHPITTPAREPSKARNACPQTTVNKISHPARMKRTPMPGGNPNQWKISPATRTAPKPLHTSIKICTMRSGTDIVMLPRCDHATPPPISCAAVAASDPPSNPTWRSIPTITATGRVRIWPNSRPAKYGIPTTTRVYAMNIFMALAA
jgi:hypothetical protein